MMKMNDRLHFTIRGTPRTKKNSLRLIVQGGKPRVLQSKAYKDYELDCLRQITGYARQNITDPVNVECVYFMPTKRRVDISNLNSSMHDILVKGGVLADDNRDVVAATDGSRVYYDHDDPRVEITITPIKGYGQWKKCPNRWTAATEEAPTELG